MKSKILVVEDEMDIRDLISLHLLRAGFVVAEASDGEEALDKLGRDSFDLFILDWMLPGTNGLDLTKHLRQNPKYARTPILMVTAKAEPTYVIEGLEQGADDYVTKPFEIPVLLARVNALLRRTTPADLVRIGDLRINLASYEVSCREEPIDLTRSEFKLLAALAQNQGRVLTRDRLISLVQGDGVAVVDRTVDTHVFGLRKKLESAGEILETVRGVGYRIRASS